eukprot:365661-Chlamydomonas_euryale.AAC.7
MRSYLVLLRPQMPALLLITSLLVCLGAAAAHAAGPVGASYPGRRLSRMPLPAELTPLTSPAGGSRGRRCAPRQATRAGGMDRKEEGGGV